MVKVLTWARPTASRWPSKMPSRFTRTVLSLACAQVLSARPSWDVRSRRWLTSLLGVSVKPSFKAAGGDEGNTGSSRVAFNLGPVTPAMRRGALPTHDLRLAAPFTASQAPQPSVSRHGLPVGQVLPRFPRPPRVPPTSASSL